MIFSASLIISASIVAWNGPEEISLCDVSPHIPATVFTSSDKKTIQELCSEPPYPPTREEILSLLVSLISAEDWMTAPALRIAKDWSSHSGDLPSELREIARAIHPDECKGAIAAFNDFAQAQAISNTVLVPGDFKSCHLPPNVDLEDYAIITHTSPADISKVETLVISKTDFSHQEAAVVSTAFGRVHYLVVPRGTTATSAVHDGIYSIPKIQKKSNVKSSYHLDLPSAGCFRYDIKTFSKDVDIEMYVSGYKADKVIGVGIDGSTPHGVFGGTIYVPSGALTFVIKGADDSILERGTATIEPSAAGICDTLSLDLRMSLSAEIAILPPVISDCYGVDLTEINDAFLRTLADLGKEARLIGKDDSPVLEAFLAGTGAPREQIDVATRLGIDIVAQVRLKCGAEPSIDVNWGSISRSYFGTGGDQPMLEAVFRGIQSRTVLNVFPAAYEGEYYFKKALAAGLISLFGNNHMTVIGPDLIKHRGDAHLVTYEPIADNQSERYYHLVFTGCIRPSVDEISPALGYSNLATRRQMKRMVRKSADNTALALLRYAKLSPAASGGLSGKHVLAGTSITAMFVSFDRESVQWRCIEPRGYPSIYIGPEIGGSMWTDQELRSLGYQVFTMLDVYLEVGRLPWLRVGIKTGYTMHHLTNALSTWDATVRRERYFDVRHGYASYAMLGFVIPSMEMGVYIGAGPNFAVNDPDLDILASLRFGGDILNNIRRHRPMKVYGATSLILHDVASTGDRSRFSYLLTLGFGVAWRVP